MDETTNSIQHQIDQKLGELAIGVIGCTPAIAQQQLRQFLRESLGHVLEWEEQNGRRGFRYSEEVTRRAYLVKRILNAAGRIFPQNPSKARSMLVSARQEWNSRGEPPYAPETRVDEPVRFWG